MVLTEPLRLLLFTFILCALTVPSAAQRVIVNSSGERVVIYPDGSWRHLEARDSLLINKDPYQKDKKPNQNGHAGQNLNKGEQYEFLLRQWNDLYANIRIEKLEAQKKFRDATNAKFKASAEYYSAEDNKKLIEPYKLASLEEAFDQSVQRLKFAKKQQKSIKSILEKATKTNAFLSKLTTKKVEKTRGEFKQYLIAFEPQNHLLKVRKAPKEKKHAASRNEKAITSVTGASGNVVAMDPSMLHQRPDYYERANYQAKPFDCTFTTDSIDAASGFTRLETTPGLIFTYTEPELRPYFKDKDLIKCFGRLSKSGPYIYLTVEFQIASSHSQSNFGALQAGSLMRFELMNGDFVALYSAKTNTGRIDPYSGTTIFVAQYALGKQALRALKKSSLNKMRVMWSTGFEDYDVYYVDFLVHQITCLESAGRH